MPRGKGNKLYDIPGKKAAARSELMTAVAVVPPKASLLLWSGEQKKTLDWRELQDYLGERAQRGAVLKRGWPRKIDRMDVQLPPPPARLSVRRPVPAHRLDSSDPRISRTSSNV